MYTLSFRTLASLFMGLLLIGGCDSFIDRSPETFASSDDFYSNPDQIEQGVVGAYGELQLLYATATAETPGVDLWIATEFRSDNTDFQFNRGNRGEDQLEAFDRFAIGDPSNNDVEFLWAQMYEGVLQTNAVLNRIDDVEFSDQTQKTHLRGEAQFLRALFYYHLVQNYGGIPLILQEARNPDAAFSEAGRASAEDVYSQILTDVENAVSNLPPASPGDGTATRATKPAARMLLARTRMTRGNFSDAVGPLRSVVEESGHMLLQNYSNVFDPDNKGHMEAIFSIGFNADVASGNEASSWIYRFAPFNSGSDLTYGLQGVDASAGFNTPTPDMINAYESGDERKAVSVGFYEDPQNTQFPEAIGDSIPYIEKYRHPFGTFNQARENWLVFRFAEAKLLLAEAINETAGPTSEALGHLNDVRVRAGLNRLTGLSLGQFREAVYQEQRVELAFENKRWYNLKRTGRALDVMEDHAQEQLQRLPPSVLASGSYQIEEFKLLLPIPFREVRLNDLQQNPMWGGG